MVKEDSEEAEDTFPEQFRSYSENDKHWEARRAFIMRNIPPGDGAEAELSSLRMDQLLSLSMVWANHLFLGCRYRPPTSQGQAAGSSLALLSLLHKTQDDLLPPTPFPFPALAVQAEIQRVKLLVLYVPQPKHEFSP